MKYDKQKEVVLAQEKIEVGKNTFVLAIHSYNGQAPKYSLGLEESSDKYGVYTTTKVGRLDLEEMKALFPKIKEFANKLAVLTTQHNNAQVTTTTPQPVSPQVQSSIEHMEKVKAKKIEVPLPVVPVVAPSGNTYALPVQPQQAKAQPMVAVADRTVSIDDFTF